MSKIIFIGLVNILLVFALAGLAYAQSPEGFDRRVKSAFIFQFTKYVEWPPRSGDFFIDVIDDADMTSQIGSIVKGSQVENRKIKVRLVTFDQVETNPGDLVVFPLNESEKTTYLLKKLKNTPCLTVTHGEGLSRAGALVNFFVVDRNMKFEINVKATKDASLNVSAKLLKLAKVNE